MSEKLFVLLEQEKGVKYSLVRGLRITFPEKIKVPGGIVSRPRMMPKERDMSPPNLYFKDGGVEIWLDNKSKVPFLFLCAGFAHDGASGPTFDTRSSWIGAAAHDGMYRWLRHDSMPELDHTCWRAYADALMYRLCRQAGMNYFRARWWYKALRKFGDPSARPSKKRKKQMTVLEWPVEYLP